MVLTSGLVFALVLFKKSIFSEVDLTTIIVVSNKYPSCSLVNFNAYYTQNHLFIIKYYEFHLYFYF